MPAFPEPIQRLMLELQADQLDRERKRVVADPAKHKKTLFFPEDAKMNYRYFAVNKTGPEIRYCWSTSRNLAGYFLGWRETVKRDGSGKRDRWLAFKRRDSVKCAARDRRDAHQKRVTPKPVKPIEERQTTYWISENWQEEIGGRLQSCSRGLGKIITTGGPNNALDKARAKWPDARNIRAFHIGRK